MKLRSLFLTEVRRSFKLNLVLFFCFFTLGFAVTSMLVIQKQLEALFSPVVWDADLVILPKGVSLEGLQRSLLIGQAEDLIPLALFQTLQTQTVHAPLRMLAFIPFKENGQVKLGYEGSTLDFPWVHDESIWRSLELSPRQDLEMYQTEEWGAKVLAGVLVRGPKTALKNLKKLIDRRTIAQAWYVNAEMSDERVRMDQLRHGMKALTGLIVVCLTPGLILAGVIVRDRLQNLLIVLQELGNTRSVKIPLYGFQFALWVVVPGILGWWLAAQGMAPLWLTFLKL